MNKNKILDKIKKMKAIINDRAAPEGEKEVARAAIDRILNKYPDIDYIDKTDEEEIINYIQSLYGGMGSFNDLVLYIGESPSVDENERLDKLRRQLFEEVIKYKLNAR